MLAHHSSSRQRTPGCRRPEDCVKHVLIVEHTVLEQDGAEPSHLQLQTEKRSASLVDLERAFSQNDRPKRHTEDLANMNDDGASIDRTVR